MTEDKEILQLNDTLNQELECRNCMAEGNFIDLSAFNDAQENNSIF